jgi:hypothetical protein
MTVLTITINDPVFEKKSAEVSYLVRVLEILKSELGRGRGTVTSGTIIGTNAAGVANTSLGSWTYAASASKP